MVITPDGSRLYVTAMGTHNVFVIDTRTNLITDVIDLWEDGFYGAWPFRLAITPDGTRIYVANMMSDNISVIDANNNIIVSTIDMDRFVHDIVITPDGRFAYVDLGWDRIPVIDLSTNVVVTVIPLQNGDQTHTLASSHDGSKVYVVSQTAGGRVYIVDVATNNVIDHFELGREVTNQGMLTVSSDDRKLYLPSGITGTSYARPREGVNKIFVIDLARRSVTEEIEIIGGPVAMVLSPDSSLGYVSTFAAGKVFIADLSNNTVVGDIGWDGMLSSEEWRKTDLRDMAISPDGSQLYITGWDSDTVLVADLATDRITNTIDLNNIMTYLYEIAITPDGKRLYVTGQAAVGGKGSLLVMDTATNSILQAIALDSYPRNPYVTSDGKLLYVVSGSRVLIIEIDTNKIVKEISLGDADGFFYDIALVRGQEKGYITNVRSQDVYVVDLKSETVANKINVGWWPQMVVVSADGSRAYVSRLNNPYDGGGLAIIETATDQVIGAVRPPRGMAPGGRHDLLALSPDGTQVYWGNWWDEVSVVDVASDQVVKTIDLGGYRDTWATRGIHPSDIAFTSDGSRGYIPCGDAYYVAVLDVTTGTIMDRIVDVGIEPVAIVLTPDDKFAYVTNKEGENISVIDLAANEVVTVISAR